MVGRRSRHTLARGGREAVQDPSHPDLRAGRLGLQGALDIWQHHLARRRRQTLALTRPSPAAHLPHAPMTVNPANPVAVESAERLQARIEELEAERRRLLAVVELLRELSAALTYRDI